MLEYIIVIIEKKKEQMYNKSCRIHKSLEKKSLLLLYWIELLINQLNEFELLRRTLKIVLRI